MFLSLSFFVIPVFVFFSSLNVKTCVLVLEPVKVEVFIWVNLDLQQNNEKNS